MPKPNLHHDPNSISTVKPNQHPNDHHWNPPPIWTQQPLKQPTTLNPVTTDSTQPKTVEKETEKRREKKIEYREKRERKRKRKSKREIDREKSRVREETKMGERE